MKSFFEGRICLVTGSSRGIGKKTAAQLLTAGATVVINGRNQTKLEETRSELARLCTREGQLFSFAADVAEPAEAWAMIAFIRQHFGRLDFLINNAGTSMRGNFANLVPATAESILRSNVLGAVYPTQAAAELLKESRGGVVFVSSLAGIRGFPGVSIYSAAKMALTALTQSLRAEWSSWGVHVGLVYLGFTENDAEKTIMTADGQTIQHKRKSQITQDQAAAALLKNLRFRQKKTILTFAGKFLSIMQNFFPFLTDFVVNRSAGKIHKIQ